jgi:hypothetical protein
VISGAGSNEGQCGVAVFSFLMASSFYCMR